MQSTGHEPGIAVPRVSTVGIVVSNGSSVERDMGNGKVALANGCVNERVNFGFTQLQFL